MQAHEVDPGSLPGDEEREMLRDSVRELLQRAGAAPGAEDLWRGLVELGATELGVDPSEGGLREILIVMEEFGRAASAAPFIGRALTNLLSRRIPALAANARGASLALAFGSLDPNPGAGSADWVDGRLSGKLRFVDAASNATLIGVVTTTPSGLVVVDRREPGLIVTPTRAIGGDGLCEIVASDVASDFIAMDPATLADLRDLGALCWMARAHGAARRAFDLAVDYAKERKQFGQPIGRFQAIQHKLADGLIALDGVRLTLANAARAFDLGTADWRYFASAAGAHGGDALRRVSLETHHAFGAIGYAEDHEAPRHFKRVHADCLAIGGATRAREALAAHLLDDPEGTLPEYDLGAAGNAFRAIVRDWLARNWSGERKAAFDAKPFEHREFDPSFALDMGKTGWIGLGWPVVFGGQARTPLEQLAFMEVMERAEAPRIGAAVQANALMMFGAPQQQAKYLPEILRGEAMHGMGYSEPNAGSDLAALTTKATREGEHWVINGQKIWTTTWWGKYMFLAARTDPDAKPKHAGISMFIVPMDTPGIDIRPSKTMYDGTFANIFYDDVRVPLDALVGEVNEGWKVLTGALANERGVVGGGIVLKVAHAFDLLCRDIRESGRQSDPLTRDRIGALAADIEVGRQLMIHCAERAVEGITPPELGAISKVFSGELMERFGESALDLLGMGAALSQGSPGALRNGRYEQGLRHSLMWVISIGTNEIQRSLIAQHGLGLPR